MISYRSLWFTLDREGTVNLLIAVAGLSSSMLSKVYSGFKSGSYLIITETTDCVAAVVAVALVVVVVLVRELKRRPGKAMPSSALSPLHQNILWQSQADS